MLNKKATEEALVLANVLKRVYKSGVEDGEEISPADVLNMLDLIIEKLEETIVSN